MTDSDTQMLCRMIRHRSKENRDAVSVLHDKGLTGHVIGVLRQELDSMVRCIFLLSIKDRAYRSRLIQDAINHRRWRTNDRKRLITDKDMVELSSRLHGWTQMVYKFGCAFIHLSAYHDYAVRDPLDELSDVDRTNLARYIEQYHGVRLADSDSLMSIASILPRVFEKITSNLECYLKDLESDEDLSN